MKIVVVTTGLNVGGAETLLLNLVKEWLKNSFKVTIFSLSAPCHLDEAFVEIGATVKNYNLKCLSNFIPGLYKFCRDIKILNPEVVQTWMPHADLIGGVFSKFFSRASIFWGCHHSDLSLKSLKFSTLVIFKLNALLSYIIPTKIIGVSHHVKTQLQDFGFDKHKIFVIENGVDCKYFSKRVEAKAKLIDELNIDKKTKIVGFVGRYSFEKNPKTFLQLATELNSATEHIHFLMVGSGNNRKNRELLSLVSAYKLEGSISLLGVRRDIPSILSSLDVLVSTSVDEAFGLALVEALACGCPCVSSNNKGAKSVGRDLVTFVEGGDIKAYVRAVESVFALAEDEKLRFSERSARYVASKFCIENSASKYINMYKQIVGKQQDINE